MGRKFIRKDGKLYTLKEYYKKIFYPDEWEVFFKNLKESQKLSFDCLLNTGGRISEVRNIKKEDINFKNNEIELKVTKSKISRKIQISSEFSKRLKKYSKNLKPNEKLKILSIPAANIAMKKALQKSNIKDWDSFSIHNIRKTFETWLCSLNTNPFIIFSHFGHCPKEAFKRYIRNQNFSLNERRKIRQIIGDVYTY